MEITVLTMGISLLIKIPMAPRLSHERKEGHKGNRAGSSPERLPSGRPVGQWKIAYCRQRRPLYLCAPGRYTSDWRVQTIRQQQFRFRLLFWIQQRLEEIGRGMVLLRHQWKKTTGWLLDNGKWYWLDSSGAMKTGWLLNESDGFWYYLKPDGSMAEGWNSLNGVWYYFAPQTEGSPGWSLVNGRWVYEKPDGYTVAEDGAWK